MVINCSSTGVVTRISVHVGSCWISASALGSDHCWSSGISRNARFSPQKKKKKRGDSYRSRMSPLSSRRHIRRSRPRRSRRCISRGRKRTLRGEMETPWAGQRGKAGQAPSALGYFKKRFGLCLLASTYRINLNSRCAYLSSIPKYRD